MSVSGQDIRKQRQALGLTLEQLAVKAGVSYAALQRIESGKTQAKAETLAKIEKALPRAQPLIYQRKNDHISIALTPESQFTRSTGFELYDFEHVALPEIDFADIDLSCTFLGKKLSSPILIASMTGGPELGTTLNRRLAEAAQIKGIGMGLGSQRITFENPESLASFQLRDLAPDILLLSNLGAVQLNYGFDAQKCRQAVEQVGADALYFHLNPLQEAIQPEGDTNFKGLWPKLETLARELPFPVLLKECGCGLSAALAKKAAEIGIAALEVSGAGGTSWARIEGHRDNPHPDLGEIFANWGIPTPESIVACRQAAPEMPLIGSGGIRTGLDMAKALALGADLVSTAKPFLEAAMVSTDAVVQRIERFEKELKIAMFCVGAKDLDALQRVGLHQR